MWPIIAAIFSVLGTGLSVYGQIRQGQTAEATARYNAQRAEQEAASARQAAAADAETKRRQLDQVLGAQRARYGGSGVIGSEGSPLLVEMQSAEEAALDVARIRYGGEARSYTFEQEARLQRYQGGRARRAGVYSAILTGVEGASKAAALYSLRGGNGGVPPYRGGYD